MSDCLCIGIDFGTTFSGVAWAFSRRPDDIRIVTKWRADLAHNSDDAKAPTELVYGLDKKVQSWGYEINPNQNALQWFKLCLVEPSDLSRDVQNSQQLRKASEMLKSKGISAIDAVSDYLRELWKHTIESIEREFGEAAVRGLPFRVVVTVPAIWKPYAMDRTRQAVAKAGILDYRLCGRTTLDLVPEPEAAALATLAEFRGRPGVKPGDVFVVCDAGGGTVDITSYKVEMTDPVVVKESVEGDGKMCGAIFVDQEFQEFIRGRISNKKWDKLSSSQVKKLMNDEWEHGIKRGFEDTDKDWDVRLPPEAFSSKPFGRSRNSLTLKQSHVRGIFDPVLGQIQALVGKQIEQIRRKEGRGPKCIMLVGGFGRCRFLYKVFKEEYSTRDIEVLQSAGNNPWTAICRGAVIKAMTATGREGAGGVSVSTRVSRRNYGLDCYETFRPDYHDPADRQWIDSEGGYFATNQMRWYLKKGADIAAHDPVRMPFYRLVRNHWDLPRDHFTISLLNSETNGARNRKTNDVSKLCDIKVRLDTPFEQLPRHINNQGIECRKLAYEVEMTCSGALLKFAAYINGRRQGEQNVEVSFL